MEQGGAGGEGGGDKNQQQQPHRDRKEKEVMQQGTEAEAEAEAEVESAPPPQLPQQPVKCPRCESVNTKFCYYNNYSLSQPRFFCKTCRRYWTHGGTLRNVPVGGSCRKAKRARDSQSSSSSADNSASSSRFNQRQQPQAEAAASQEIHQPNQQQHLMAPVMMGPRDMFPLGLPSHLTTHFLQGGGFGLGSASAAAALGGIHHQSSSLNPPPNNNPFDLQALNVGGGSTTSNLQGVLSGLINASNNNNNVGDSVVGAHQRQIRPSSHQQYFQLGVGERDIVDPLFPPISEQLQALMIPSSSSTMANSSTSAGIHPDWTHHHHRFITVNDAAANNNNNNIAAAAAAAGGSMWSTVSTTAFSANGNNSRQRQRNVAASAAATANVMPNHHQWPNVPGFGPPPPPPPSSF